MKPLLSELSRLLPDLTLLFPDLVSVPTSLAADPEQGHGRNARSAWHGIWILRRLS
jgi:hypothetical protein